MRLDSALSLLNPLRLLFWLIMAMGLWALLRPRLLRRPRRIAPAMAAPLPESVWLDPTAVLAGAFMLAAHGAEIALIPTTTGAVFSIRAPQSDAPPG